MGLTDYTISDKKYWQAGRDYERQRIIKIAQSVTATACICDNCNTARKIIELIEGENNGQDG